MYWYTPCIEEKWDLFQYKRNFGGELKEGESGGAMGRKKRSRGHYHVLGWQLGNCHAQWRHGRCTVHLYVTLGAACIVTCCTPRLWCTCSPKLSMLGRGLGPQPCLRSPLHLKRLNLRSVVFGFFECQFFFCFGVRLQAFLPLCFCNRSLWSCDTQPASYPFCCICTVAPRSRAYKFTTWYITISESVSVKKISMRNPPSTKKLQFSLSVVLWTANNINYFFIASSPLIFPKPHLFSSRVTLHKHPYILCTTHWNQFLDFKPGAFQPGLLPPLVRSFLRPEIWLCCIQARHLYL